MSWDGWLPFMQSDGTNTCSHECGIFDTQGNPWAKTANCNVSKCGEWKTPPLAGDFARYQFK